jgi:hypothetical protein
MEAKDDLKLQSAFLAAEDKPRVSLSAFWVIWRATRDDKMCELSFPTIADRAGCSPSSAQRDVKEYERLGWVTRISGKKKGRSNRYQVELADLPYGDLKPTIVSDEGKRWATKYHVFLSQHSSRRGKKRPPAAWKGWQHRWAFTFQKFMKMAGGDDTLILSVLNAALTHPDYYKRALLGPDHLRSCWWKLVEQVAGAEKARKLREDQRKQSREMAALARKAMAESSKPTTWTVLPWPTSGDVTPWAPRQVAA